MGHQAAQADQGLRVDFPWDGDVLNRHDGIETADGLLVSLRGRAWRMAEVEVDGRPAIVSEDGRFEAPVRITRREQTILVDARSGSRVEQQRIRVMWDARSRPRFRFSVDDNVLFLRDLARSPDQYPSLFDHWYLRFWREMHTRYGARIHINIYFTDGEDFTLQQMPDRWKGEWADNATWLRLTFHARADKPDRIYKDATYEELATDIERVHEQILRFAGPEVLSPWTTLHWAECPREAAKALRDAGYRGLIILAREPVEKCTTRYYLPDGLVRHLAGRDAWKDFDMDLLFVNCDIVVNSVPLADIPSYLERQLGNGHTGELAELLIHEQYFRQDLPTHYQPDAFERVRAAIEFVHARGYQPVLWSEEFL